MFFFIISDITSRVRGTWKAKKETYSFFFTLCLFLLLLRFAGDNNSEEKTIVISLPERPLIPLPDSVLIPLSFFFFLPLFSPSACTVP